MFFNQPDDNDINNINNINNNTNNNNENINQNIVDNNYYNFQNNPNNYLNFQNNQGDLNDQNDQNNYYNFQAPAKKIQYINIEALDKTLAELNPAQRQAVTSKDAHTLILAGAGSGKTKVLTTRMAHLIGENLAHIEEMMAVTFTNKAAREMQHRLSHILGRLPQNAYIGTFHGLCHRFLRIHNQAAHLPTSFQILDRDDQQSLLKKIYKEHQISDEQYPLKNTLNFINQAKERGERAKDVQISYAAQSSLLQIYALYEQTCQKLGVLDFSELLLRCYELFTQNPDILAVYQRRFKYILIDEFQDTNVLQYQWLKLFYHQNPIDINVTHNAKFFAVGDDDQSIYGFRGARVGNMHDFAKNFQAAIIKLEQNYRSSATILECANTLIRHNTNRLGKELFTEQNAAQPVIIHKAFHQDLEAFKIAEHIQELRSRGLSAKNIAVLYRNNAQSRVFEHVFFQQQIPYKVYGGLRFFERLEIKHAIAYLQLVDDVHQIPAFARVVNVPARGIGLKTVEGLQNFANEQNLSFYQASLSLGGKLLNFTRLLDELTLLAKTLTLPELIQEVIVRTGLLNFYETENEEGRVDNLKELVSAAQSFVREQNYQTQNSTENIYTGEFSTTPLRHFLGFSALEGVEEEEENQAIQLMSIHASKGLEFDYVFLAGLEEGLFPSYASCQADEVEEERRLMYVAITRAKKGLHISFAESRMLYGTTNYNKPSRFLDELPSSATNWMPPKETRQRQNLQNNKNINNINKTNNYYKKNEYGNSSNNSSNNNGYSRSYESNSNYNSNYNLNSKNEYYVSKQEQKIQNDYHHAAMKNTGLVIEQNNSKISYKIGQKVFSSKFGEGVIKNIQGQNEQAIVEVSFKRFGPKNLQLNLAKLQIIED